MKKNLVLVLFGLLMVSPISAHASIFEDLYGAVQNLQKQVVNLVSIKIDLPSIGTTTVSSQTWKTFSDPAVGFEIRYPDDWSTTTIFSLSPRYKQADAFVRNSRIAFLSKIIKPSSTSIEIAVQDSAIFFYATSTDEFYASLDQTGYQISTSTKQVGSSTVMYILHSAKNDKTKFGGGSTEQYVFQNGSSSIIAEANYGEEIPSGPVKVVFDKMLPTLKLIESLPDSSLGSTTAQSASTTVAEMAGTSTVQTAGVKLSQ